MQLRRGVHTKRTAATRLTGQEREVSEPEVGEPEVGKAGPKRDDSRPRSLCLASRHQQTFISASGEQGR